MNNTKLIIVDIDNTLVEKHHDLTPYTVRVLHELKQRGIWFGLGSGRDIAGVQTLARKWQIDPEMMIGLNGGELYDQIAGTTEHLYDLDPQSTKEIFTIMAPFLDKVTYYVRLNNGEIFTNRHDERNTSSAAYLGNQQIITHYIDDDPSILWSQPIPKIGFRSTRELTPLIEERAKQFPSDRFRSFRTEFDMYEFCNIHADKGELLKLFCKRHGLDMSEVVAMGDMTNDNTMLQAAGWGVCMINGSDDCKAIADEITEKDCMSDGCADYIAKRILHMD